MLVEWDYAIPAVGPRASSSFGLCISTFHLFLSHFAVRKFMVNQLYFYVFLCSSDKYIDVFVFSALTFASLVSLNGFITFAVLLPSEKV